MNKNIYKHPLHIVWKNMLYRCYNKKHDQYKYYGGRGLEVYPEWKENYTSFYEWCISHGWEKGLELDRFPDNNKGYYPDNCRFVTRSVNHRNRRNNISITINGETKLLIEWCEIKGVSPGLVRRRLNAGWSNDDLFIDSCREDIVITYNNKTRSLNRWAEITGIDRNVLYYRYKIGYTPDRLFKEPNRRSKGTKYAIESTTPGFPEIEKALFIASEKIGWKSLTAFLVSWTKKHQPKDNPYTLKSWNPI